MAGAFAVLEAECRLHRFFNIYFLFSNCRLRRMLIETGSVHL